MSEARKIRRELVYYARKIMAEGLVAGPGGNLSARAGDVMYISPSGYSFEEAEERDYVGVDVPSGRIVEGDQRPSSEVLMHLACYRKRADIRALVHTHPPITVGLISAGVDLKPMYPDFYVFLGEHIPHLDYVTVTTPKLAKAVEDVIGEANAVLLRNHGVLTVGANLKQAYYRTQTVEEGAKILSTALQVGAPRYLSREEIEELKHLGSEQYRQQLLEKMQSR